VSSMLPVSSRLLRKWRASSVSTDSGLTLRSAILTMKKEEA
jgi:hypothetical protein